MRLLGTGRAKELALLRDSIDAEEALRLGLVTEVVAAGNALERALALADHLASLPPLAVTLTKQAIDAMAESSREAGILVERIAYAALAQTPEAQDAVEAFLSRHRSGAGGGAA